MAKVRFTDDSYRKEPWFRALCSALVACQSEEEVANLLRDVGTLSELQAWSERLEVAKLVTQGLSYRDVAKKTGASTTTVTRVAKFVENGPGGYRKFLNAHRHHRMHHTPSGAPSALEGRPLAQSTEDSMVPQQNVQNDPASMSPSTAPTSGVSREEKPVSLLQKYLQK